MDNVTIIDENGSQKLKKQLSIDEQNANWLCFMVNLLELLASIFVIIYFTAFYANIPARVKQNSIIILITIISLLVVSLALGLLIRRCKLLKYFLLTIQIVSVSLLNLIYPFGDFSFLLLLPGILSFRYCDFKLTLKIMIFGYAEFFLLNFFSTFFSVGFIDVDFHAFVAGYTPTETSTYEELLTHLDGLGSFLRGLYYNILPATCFSIVIVLVGGAISRANNRNVEYRVKYGEQIALSKAELNVANKIQLDMIPENFSELNKIGYFQVYALISPAREVGGDFYDVFSVDDNHLAFLIADVSGKGVPAALFMAESKALLKGYILSGLNIEDAMKKVNEDLTKSNKSKLFVTVWAGLLDLKTGIIQYVDAGHNYAVVVPKNGDIYFLNHKPQKFLGFFKDLTYESYSLTLNINDRLLLYTDGAIDIENKENQSYGRDRFLETVKNNKNNNINDCLINVKKELDSFATETAQFDDITMLMLEYNGKKNNF